MKKKKLVCGIGVNDVDYVVQKFETIIVNGKRKSKLVWYCPYFRTWKNMIERCYSVKYQERNPTYKGCYVSDEWLTFSNFKNWMRKQDWEGKQLDKDILSKDSKVYSDDICVFISPMVNSFVIDCGASRGDRLIGVYLHKPSGKFLAQCRNPITKKHDHLGYFTNEIDGHNAWKARKLELAKQLADIQSDPRVAKALIDRYS